MHDYAEKFAERKRQFVSRAPLHSSSDILVPWRSGSSTFLVSRRYPLVIWKYFYLILRMTLNKARMPSNAKKAAMTPA